MIIVPFNSYAAADTVNKAAFTYVVMDDGARGARWSAVYQSPDTTQYGIVYADDIAGALTAPQLASVTDVTGWTEYTPP